MAKSTKESEKRIWLAYRQKNGSLSAQGFSDILESEDGANWTITQTAEQRAGAFVVGNDFIRWEIVAGVKTAEATLAWAQKENL